MFDLSPEKILVLGIIAFVVLGPDRLPALARKAGRLLVQARQVSGGFREELRGALSEPREALSNAAEEFGLPGITGIPRVPSVRGVITSALFDVPAAEEDEDEDEDEDEEHPRTSASTAATASVQPVGLPPVPDDPTLN